MTVHPDGRVDWRGVANVRVVGDAHGAVAPRVLAQLELALELAKFWTRRSDGRLPTDETITICTDSSEIRIEAAAAGKHQVIEYQTPCIGDDGLRPLADQLDQLAGTAAWR